MTEGMFRLIEDDADTTEVSHQKPLHVRLPQHGQN